MKILLFAGAGTSIELGVPGMIGLATEFIAHTKQWSVEPALVERIIGDNLDLEHLIEELDRLCEARRSLESIGLDTETVENAERVRAEVEWFVQHSAERVTAYDARIMWGPVLRATTSSELTIVTTNYDRAIELAANAEGICLEDGFGDSSLEEAKSWSGFRVEPQGPTLVKLHGSTDWYEDCETEKATRLRHPMPLFGNANLRFGDRELGSAIVLPSREKFLNREPYPRLSQKFLNTVDSCDLAVFIGTSLRDTHIRQAASAVAQRIPVFLVNPDGKTHGISGTVAIVQCSSKFLVSTLPNALMSLEPEVALRCASQKDSMIGNGLIDPTRRLLNENGEAKDRCEAIDELDAIGATLPPQWIRNLLNDDNATVARYALGLILLSPSAEELIAEAESCRHSQDPTFGEEYMLLRKMFRQREVG